MSDSNQQQKPWDAVLGGQNQPKPYDAVLGKIKQITTTQKGNSSAKNKSKLNQESLSENNTQGSKIIGLSNEPSNSNTVNNANLDKTKDSEALSGCGCLITLWAIVSGPLALFVPLDSKENLVINFISYLFVPLVIFIFIAVIAFIITVIGSILGVIGIALMFIINYFLNKE